MRYGTKHPGLILGIALLFITPLCGFGAIANGLDYKPEWKWSRGQTRKYHITIERSQTTRVERTFKTKLRLDAVMRMETRQINPNDVELGLVFDRIGIENHAGNIHSRFDSAVEAASNRSSIWTLAGRALMDCELIMTQSAAGDLVIESGFSDALDDALGEYKQTEPRDAFIIYQLFGDRGFRRILRSMFRILPEAPVSRGQSWRQNEVVELGLGAEVRRSTEYRLADIARDRRYGTVATIESNGRMESVAGKIGNIRLPGGEAEVRLLDNSIAGSTDFSIDLGCIIEQNMDGILSMETTLTDDGPNVEQRNVHSKLVQKIRLNLMEPAEDDQ